MGKLQTHWRCLYELSTMKRRAMACFVPRRIKKSSSLSVSLQGIVSPKSEQINHLEKNEGGCVPVCGALTGCVCLHLGLSTRVVHVFVCRCATKSILRVFVSQCIVISVSSGYCPRKPDQDAESDPQFKRLSRTMKL